MNLETEWPVPQRAPAHCTSRGGWGGRGRSGDYSLSLMSADVFLLVGAAQYIPQPCQSASGHSHTALFLACFFNRERFCCNADLMKDNLDSTLSEKNTHLAYEHSNECKGLSGCWSIQKQKGFFGCSALSRSASLVWVQPDWWEMHYLLWKQKKTFIYFCNHHWSESDYSKFLFAIKYILCTYFM